MVKDNRKRRLEVKGMLAFIINDMERKEMEYVVKRELEEILMDLEDERIDDIVKETMCDRYQDLFKLLHRVVSEQECSKYRLNTRKYNKTYKGLINCYSHYM